MVTTIEHQGVRIPIKIKQDRRRSIRYSITKKSVNLLMPKGMSQSFIEQEIAKVTDWCKVEFEKDPELLNRFRTIFYTNGEFIRVFGQDFQLLIFREKRAGCTGKLIKGKYVEFKVPIDADETEIQEAIGKLLSRIFSSYFHKQIVNRVNSFNDRYFQEKIENVRLKNNHSNWGSCSSQRNINLSSRLLFAPTEVLDYVIVHELAHLKEMNHSPRFWKIVRDVMPDYELKEKWLKEHGQTLKF